METLSPMVTCSASPMFVLGINQSESFSQNKSYNIIRSGVSRAQGRSPSPGRHQQCQGPLADKMSLVLELALTVLVSQSVLSLATSDQRDTQVLTN